ncbi:uncharacterized protein At2g24330 [Lactuca sativa]|uniref:Lunapark zinc ribbon domain-containing protein n=1 Tax=Lactuca sativa TaxID=4236 RepID=A0A9R1V3S6_LACSA|nr:uncharacterized protein At2g24330 [Lactuca sativa]KAJ0197741.1 hypothetical protein LSAT_V11C700382550 [Lactuca sativa]
MADEKEVKEVVGEKTDDKNKSKSKKKTGILSRIWNTVFRSRSDDFEKRLQYISKEEATLLSRMKRRALRWRRTARNIIIFSVILEFVAIGYAIMTTRTVNMDWRTRSLRVLPMFLLPAISFALHYGLLSFTRFGDRRDQKALERLRAERQAKIDELKERTNYYITQQLIQKYDPDPAAKAAAASVLASKLGADSGLKMFLGDESQPNPYATKKNNEVEVHQTTGLRKRNQSNLKSQGSNTVNQQSETEIGDGVSERSSHGDLVVDHHDPATLGGQDGGWIARIAAMLVGEDPTQSYALICGNCHMHNGLVRKEEFPFITYYCPHCHALNKPKNSGVSSETTMSPVLGPSRTVSADVKLIEENNEKVVPGEIISHVAGDVEEKEGSEKIVGDE